MLAPDAGVAASEDAATAEWIGCASSAYLLCDDFESGEVNPSRWRRAQTNGSTSVTMEQAAHGRFALEARIDGTAASRAWLVHEASFPMASDHFFGRMFVFHEGPPPAHNWNYATASGMLGGERTEYRLGGTTSPFGDPEGTRVVRWMYMPAHVATQSTVPIETDRWQCWEWEVNAADDELRVWQDGAELTELHGTDTFRRGPWIAPEIDRVEIGLSHPNHSEGDRDLRVFIDDVVLDDERIGCD